MCRLSARLVCLLDRSCKERVCRCWIQPTYRQQHAQLWVFLRSTAMVSLRNWVEAGSKLQAKTRSRSRFGSANLSFHPNVYHQRYRQGHTQYSEPHACTSTCSDQWWLNQFKHQLIIPLACMLNTSITGPFSPIRSTVAGHVDTASRRGNFHALKFYLNIHEIPYDLTLHLRHIACWFLLPPCSHFGRPDLAVPRQALVANWSPLSRLFFCVLIGGHPLGFSGLG